MTQQVAFSFQNGIIGLEGTEISYGCQDCIPDTILLINTVETFLIGHGFTQIGTDTCNP